MRRVLRYESARLLPRAIGDGLRTWKRRWIKIVPEIEAHRTDWCLVAQPDTNRVRNITIVALAGSALLQAELRILLPPAQQIVQHILAIGKDISSIFENDEAHVVLDKRQGGWWKAHFQVIEEKCAAADGKPGNGVARTCLI